MAASKNMIALEINGLHVYLAFAPFPADDTVATVRTILKKQLRSDAPGVRGRDFGQKSLLPVPCFHTEAGRKRRHPHAETAVS